MDKETKIPSTFGLLSSVLTLSGLILILLSGLLLLGLYPHMVLFLAIIYLCFVGLMKGSSWTLLENSMMNGLASCLKALLILLMIGMVIAAWIQSGTVAYLFAVGLKLFSPQLFLPSCVIVTILISTFTGSSLTTGGTVGVALMGIGHVLGVDPAMCAGAVLSGSFFGDKMSPLSDTTNFAPGIVGTDLFTHIQHMLGTTVPSLILTLLLFLFLGRNLPAVETGQLEQMATILGQNFNLSPWVLISPFLVIILAFKRYPTIPILIIGILSALMTTGFIQGNWDLGQWFNTLFTGFKATTGDRAIDSLLTRGGFESMMFSVSLVIMALLLGGTIQGLNLLSPLISLLEKKKITKGPLVLLTTLFCAFINLITGEQYLSILIPGQTFRPIYDDLKIHPKVLSRTLEDGGTLLNALVPWGVCGAFFSTTLNVPVTHYAPYAFFLYLCPIFTIILGFKNTQRV